MAIHLYKYKYCFYISHSRFGMICDDFLNLWWANLGSFAPSFVSYALHIPNLLQLSSSFPSNNCFYINHPIKSKHVWTSIHHSGFFQNTIHGYQFWVLPVGIHFQKTSSRLGHPRCIPALEASIREVDQAYDSCNEAWARGEADKFRSSELLIFWVYPMFLSSFWLTTPRWNNLCNFGYIAFLKCIMALHFTDIQLESTGMWHMFSFHPDAKSRFVNMAEERMKKATFTPSPEYRIELRLQPLSI